MSFDLLCGLRSLAPEDTLEYLFNLGVVMRNDHFVYTKGGHGESYVNIKGLMDVQALHPLAIKMADHVYCSDFRPDVIVGVPHGADILASQVAIFYSLISNRQCLNLKLLKVGKKSFCWYKNHGDYIRRRKALLIEDVVNTGVSLSECSRFLIYHGCSELGLSVVCDRISLKNPGLNIHGNAIGANYVGALSSIEVANHDIPIGADPRLHCPLCRDGKKMNTEIGYGKAFLEKNQGAFPELCKQLS